MNLTVLLKNVILIIKSGVKSKTRETARLQEKIEILGGHSGCGRITFFTDQFKVTAKYGKSGTITTTIKRQPRLIQYLLRHDSYLLPRVLRMIMILMGNISPKGWLGIMLLIGGLALLQHYYPSSGESIKTFNRFFPYNDICSHPIYQD